VKSRLGGAVVVLFGFPLLAAALACGSTTPPKVIAPLPEFTMPPESPTPEPEVFAVEGWQTLSGNQIELMLPPSYEGGDPVILGAVSWQLTYALRHGDQVWNLNFGAIREDFPRLQPIFDQSLQTVRFTP
jgi:hypothetical protein